MNILCMGGRTVGLCVAWDLARTFLEGTYSSDERHLRRVGKVAAVEATRSELPPAPLKELQRKFGFEPDHVVAAAKELLLGVQSAR